MPPQKYSDGDPNNFEKESGRRNGVSDFIACDVYGHNNLQRIV
jgi:hypothetical protein